MRSLIRYSLLLGALIPALASAFTPINLAKGWNLVGNSDPAAIDVAAKLSGSAITTVWKWNKVDNKWAFYTPSMTSTELAAYALSKQYDVLSTIDSKEGFWVNANAAVTITDMLAPPPVVGTGVTLGVADLAPSWNLVASADKKTPSQLNAGLASSLTAANKSISTLWAWDAGSSSWRFYAPSLETNGQLASYINSKSYLPFTSVLAVTDGFWMNIGAATPVVNSPSPSASLSTFRFTSLSDWFMRVSSSTSLENTKAADGSSHYRYANIARSGGEPYTWAWGDTPNRGADVHWNGQNWINCPINFEHTNFPADANGITSYNYCNGWETGTSLGNTSTTIDVSGRTMIDVYGEIVAANYTNVTIANPETALGTAVFPTGAKYYKKSYAGSSQPTIGYYPGGGNRLTLPNAQLAAGDTTMCNASTWPSGSANPTLEQLIAVSRGTPCVYGPATVTGANGVTLSSGTRNEYWTQTTLSMGTIGSAATYTSSSNATAYYTTNQLMRVAFAANNVANYYSCQQRWNDSTRNCDLIGSGSYVIETHGDARTMRFTGLPAQFDALSYERVFVERGGNVYWGYLSKAKSSTSARFNLTGMNALFGALGLSNFNPDDLRVMTLGSYAGTYNSTFTGTDSGTVTTTISPSGATSCSGTSTQAGAFACSFSVTPTGVDGTTANVNLGITGTGAVFTGTANYYTGVVTGTWTNTGGASGTFTGARQ